MGSPSTFVAFTSSTCSDVNDESLTVLDANQKLEITFNSPKTYHICLSTRGRDKGALVMQAFLNLTVISDSLSLNVTGINPTLVSSDFSQSFTIFSTAASGLWSQFSFAALVLETEKCEDQAALHSIPLLESNTFSQQLPTVGWYRLCFSTNSRLGPYSEHDMARVQVFAAATKNRIVSIEPTRILKGEPTFVVFEGANASISTSISVSKSFACDNSVQTISLSLSNGGFVHIPSNITESELVICYSTGGQYVLQSNVQLHTIFPANQSSVSNIVPDRIAARHSMLITFVGADFSSISFVGIAPFWDTNCSMLPGKQGQILALKSGAGSQSDSIAIELSDPGIYQTCYSTSGPGGPWHTQHPTITVIRKADGTTLQNLSVCTPKGEVCTMGTEAQIPLGVVLNYTFWGVDFSADTLVAFSQYRHPMLGRPDCSSGRVNEYPVNRGSGNQSDSISMAFEIPGRYHFCISTQSGIVGSWWPKADHYKTAVPSEQPRASDSQAAQKGTFVNILAPVTNQSITSLEPSAAESLRLTAVTFEGAIASAFSRLKLALPGQCNDDSKAVSIYSLNESNTLQLWAPTSAVYKVCYQHFLQGFFQEQSHVFFTTFDPAQNNSIVEMRTKFTSQVGSSIILSAGHTEYVQFLGAAYADTVMVGFTANDCGDPCTNSCFVSQIPVLEESLDFDNFTRVRIWIPGNLSVCYKTFQTWQQQTLLSVSIIPVMDFGKISRFSVYYCRTYRMFPALQRSCPGHKSAVSNRSGPLQQRMCR